ncbi:NADH-quinone oxidoreductase subunit NuoK [Hugenholtzia roseola]|uniref:NADH-quinone oxidoreductase subunit NuoK n=1 Tax=Hugenholtzia roseola TaxID=1002 RepID=UPI000688CC1F|nr:NADH-quinone oxidoreductase subunit NuoK [Hugenholtzia roseola]
MPSDAILPAQGLIALSGLLFSLGLAVVIVKKNPILILIGIELMLNAANLNFVAFDNQQQGHLMALFVMVLAAAEVAIALAILRQIYQHLKTTQLDHLEASEKE